VSELIKRCGLTSLVDLGCGDGGLIRHMLTEAAYSTLHRLVGVDVSHKELAAAARRLGNMQSSYLTLQPVEGCVLQPVEGVGGAAAAGEGEGEKGGSRRGVAAAAAAPAGPPASSDAAAGGGGTAARVGSSSNEGEGSTLSGAAAALTGGGGGTQTGLQQQDSPPLTHTQSSASSIIFINTLQQQQQQQQQQGDTTAAAVAASEDNSWSVELELLQGDLTNPALASPDAGFWQAHSLNPGCVDMAACIEVLEHLEPRAVDALGVAVLGGLRPKVAVFTTPNWEYNVVLRTINAGERGGGGGEGGGLTIWYLTQRMPAGWMA